MPGPIVLNDIVQDQQGDYLSLINNSRQPVLKSLYIYKFRDGSYEIIIRPSNNINYLPVVNALEEEGLLQPDIHDVTNLIIKFKTRKLVPDLCLVLTRLFELEPRLADVVNIISEFININFVLDSSATRELINIPERFWNISINPIIRLFSYSSVNNHQEGHRDRVLNDAPRALPITRLYQSKPVLPPGLNSIQNKILHDFLQFVFDDVAEMKVIDDQILVLGTLLSDELSENENSILNRYDLLGSYQDLRKIFNHPCPQNRSVDYPYFGKHATDPEKYVVYKNEQGVAAFEERGLLSLTARLDDKHGAPTKQQVCDFLTKLINKEVEKYEYQKMEEIDRTILWLAEDKTRTLALTPYKCI